MDSPVSSSTYLHFSIYDFQELIAHLRKEMAYEILRLKGNKADFPNYLYGRIDPSSGLISKHVRLVHGTMPPHHV